MQRARCSSRLFSTLVMVAVFVPISVEALAQDRSLEVGASRLERATLEPHIAMLADPELQGRANGSEGAEAAARHIEDSFRKSGLAPGVGDSSFVQAYKMYTGVRVEGVIGFRDLVRGYQFSKDYTPLGLSGDGHTTTTLAFVGYGVTAPEYGYDDYAGLDVTGKIVIAMLGEPGMRDPDSPFDGTSSTTYSDLYTKAINAREHGAAGLLLTPGPLYARDVDRVWKISQDIGFRDTGIMVCQVTNQAAAGLLQPAGLELRVLQEEIDQSMEPRSIDLTELRAELMVKLRREEANLENIVAKIPGRTDDAIVVLANYDGFGLGLDSSNPSVHPSANDNATGVAAMLEIARVMKSMPKPEKTVYFAAVSGRRLGSVGADAMVRANVCGDQVACVISAFAIGRSGLERLEVMGTESGSGLAELARQVNEQVADPVDLRIDRRIAKAGDHIPFYKTGAPTLTVFGGAFEDHGSSEDTLEELDYASLAQNTRYLYGLIQSISSLEGSIDFQP